MFVLHFDPNFDNQNKTPADDKEDSELDKTTIIEADGSSEVVEVAAKNSPPQASREDEASQKYLPPLVPLKEPEDKDVTGEKEFKELDEINGNNCDEETKAVNEADEKVINTDIMEEKKATPEKTYEVIVEKHEKKEGVKRSNQEDRVVTKKEVTEKEGDAKDPSVSYSDKDSDQDHVKEKNSSSGKLPYDRPYHQMYGRRMVGENVQL
jgi:hypothetical protein